MLLRLDTSPNLRARPVVFRVNRLAWHLAPLRSASEKLAKAIHRTDRTNICIGCKVEERGRSLLAQRLISIRHLGICSIIVIIYSPGPLKRTNIRTRPLEIMILGPISLIDCVLFVLCLIPSLLVLAGPLRTLSLIKVIPFLGILLLPFICQASNICSTCWRYKSL